MKMENPVYNELRHRRILLDTERESALVRRARQGEANACEQLFYDVAALGFKLFRSHGQDPDAHLGEIYLLFTRSLGSFDDGRGASFRTWFHTQCQWAAFGIRRQEWNERGRYAERIADWSPDNAKSADTAAETPPAWPELTELWPLFEGKELGLLRYMAGLDGDPSPSLAKLARAWGCSRQNAHALFTRIARKVREHFGAREICMR